MSFTLDLFIDEGCTSAFDSIDGNRWFDTVDSIMQQERTWLNGLNVIVMPDEAHTSLNNKYLGHNYSTDVLTFDLSDDEGFGEVYINEMVTKRNASEYGIEPIQELDRLVIHGVLHLMGYNDSTDEERSEMKLLEDKYMKLIIV